MTHQRKIWAKSYRKNKYERIYDGQILISNKSISNKWIYVIKVCDQNSDAVYYGFSKSARNAVLWKPKQIKFKGNYTREVHTICRGNKPEPQKKVIKVKKIKPHPHCWHNPSIRLPNTGEKVIVKRHNDEYGLWEEESAWGGRIFLCDLYGHSKVVQWRKKTAFD